MSNLYDILTGVSLKVAAIPPMLDAAVIPVVIRKLPKHDEGLASSDATTQITICKSDRKEITIPFAFKAATGGARYKKIYFIEVTLLTPNNADAITNLAAYATLREQIEDAFRTPFSNPILPGTTQIMDLDVIQGDFLDLSNLAAGYDYAQTIVAVTTIE